MMCHGLRPGSRVQPRVLQGALIFYSHLFIILFTTGYGQLPRPHVLAQYAYEFICDFSALLRGHIKTHFFDSGYDEAVARLERCLPVSLSNHTTFLVNVVAVEPIFLLLPQLGIHHYS